MTSSDHQQCTTIIKSELCLFNGNLMKILRRRLLYIAICVQTNENVHTHWKQLKTRQKPRIENNNNRKLFVNYVYKIAPNIVNLAVARPSMAVGRGTGGLSPPVPLQTTPTNPGEYAFDLVEIHVTTRIPIDFLRYSVPKWAVNQLIEAIVFPNFWCVLSLSACIFLKLLQLRHLDRI